MSIYHDFTIILPVYNEAGALDKVLSELIEASHKHGFKIIAVEDGSTDASWDVLQKYAKDIKLLQNRMNLGYGASLKRGIRAAQTSWIATCDADGQHRLEDLLNLMTKTKGVDGVFGRRQSASHVSFARVPGKWVLKHITNFLVKSNIDDINCGLRVIKRKAILKLLDLCSDQFSFSVSSMVALIKSGHTIIFEPVTTDKRIGKSSVNQLRDGFNIIIMIMRLITLFDPLRIFLPVALGLFFIGFAYQLMYFALYGLHIVSATVLLGLAALITFFMALLADQVSSMRREMIDIKNDDCSNDD